MLDSAPGPDGLCYSFWANAPPPEALAARASPPPWLLDSVTTLIPQGDAATTSDALTMTAAELRPITFMQDIAKHIAYQANEALSELASQSVAAPQRGFVKHRNTAKNILEFDSKLFDASQGVSDARACFLTSRPPSRASATTGFGKCSSRSVSPPRCAASFARSTTSSAPSSPSTARLSGGSDLRVGSNKGAPYRGHSSHWGWIR